jgi:hypothetical protein
MTNSMREHRDRLERFVCRENVTRFRQMLSNEPDEGERKMLIVLLKEEEEKQRCLGDFSLPPAAPVWR